MATKDCPSCGATVPASAARCKECFHDFTAEPKKSGRGGMIFMLGLFAAMAVIAALSVLWVINQPLDRRVLVNEEHRTIDFVAQYRDGPKTDRISWDQVAALEHVTRSDGDFEIVAVLVNGDRKVIEVSTDKPLLARAKHYEQLMSKPLKEVDNSLGGFGEDR